MPCVKIEIICVSRSTNFKLLNQIKWIPMKVSTVARRGSALLVYRRKCCFIDNEQMAELFADKWEQLPYPSLQGGEMTPTARVANIRRFVCGVATSLNALQHHSCLHSPTLITYTCAELNILDWWRHAASETNYWTTKYTTCLRILSKYLHKRFGWAKRSENVSEMFIVL